MVRQPNPMVRSRRRCRLARSNVIAADAQAPSPSRRQAQREVPTPLVFLSATEWDKTAPTDDETGGFTAWSAMYSSRGYTCVECDLKPPSPLPETSAELMQHFVTRAYLASCGASGLPWGRRADPHARGGASQNCRSRSA